MEFKVQLHDGLPSTPAMDGKTLIQDEYALTLDTPNSSDPGLQQIENGALRSGKMPIVWSRDYVGLLAQYAGVGLMIGTLPATIYPFLLNYLNMEGTQVISARVLLVLPWVFKLFYGMASDCIPVGGYRRRPFMMIGWSVCALMLLIMACMRAGRPYYPEYIYSKVNPTTLSAEVLAEINPSARTTGSKFIVLMMLAAVGYVGADVAADAMIVELAQREPLEKRGTLQTACYLVRAVFAMLASILVGFTFNGSHYGGDFSYELSFPQLMLILTMFIVPVIPLTWLFIKEERHEGIVLRDYMRTLWLLVQSRVVYEVIAFKFFSGIFENFTITCADPMEALWAGATPLNDKIAKMIGFGIYAVVLFCTSKYGLHWDWRWMHVITLVAATAVDAFVTLLTTWNVVRTQWFWLGVPIVANLPNAIGFILSGYVIVELSGEGNEGAVYGLLSSVQNLAIPMATTITKNVDAQFKVTNADIRSDTNEVRWDVTYVLLIRYGMNLFGLVFLPLLPRQKTETQELKRHGGSNKWIGLVTIVYLAFALVWAVMINVMAIYPSTSCLKIVGGKGC